MVLRARLPQTDKQHAHWPRCAAQPLMTEDISRIVLEEANSDPQVWCGGIIKDEKGEMGYTLKTGVLKARVLQHVAQSVGPMDVPMTAAQAEEVRKYIRDEREEFYAHKDPTDWLWKNIGECQAMFHGDFNTPAGRIKFIQDYITMNRGTLKLASDNIWRRKPGPATEALQDNPKCRSQIPCDDTNTPTFPAHECYEIMEEDWRNYTEEDGWVDRQRPIPALGQFDEDPMKDWPTNRINPRLAQSHADPTNCLLYTSDAADE